MKWLCSLRLLGLSSLSAVATGTPQLRAAGASLLEVIDNSQSWDYNDEGQSWGIGNCPNANTDFSQSPVNFSTTVAANAPDNHNFFFKYDLYEEPVKMVNDGRFLYTVFPADKDMGGFSFGRAYPTDLDVEYSLYKMVFHSPSEHTYEGERVPLEVQLIHYKKGASLTDGEASPEDTAILAIGFMESRDEASPFLRALIDGGLPDQRGATTMDNRQSHSTLDFSKLLKPVFGAQGEKQGFWDYSGSLTQPPCSGGVRWLVRHDAMNAKIETLNLFSNSVRKSSGGVPGSARGLQIMGPRPVFPRYAQNAIRIGDPTDTTKNVFNPDEPDAFADAMGRVKQHQGVFKEKLAADSAGSGAAMRREATLEDTVLASQEYRMCMNEQGRVLESTKVAKVKQTSDCNQMKGAKETLVSITGGPARIEAAAKHASLAKSCEDQTRVAMALEGQQEKQQEQCDIIKKGIVKKYEARKAKEAAEAKAKEEAAVA